MPIISLHYCALDEAEGFCPTTDTIAISILSPGRAPARLSGDIEALLRLYFHDCVASERNPAGVEVFSPAHALQLIELVLHHDARAEARHLLIHCEAGISRSAAVAVFAASECGLPLTGKFAFLNPWVLSTLVRTDYPHYAFD